MFLSYRNLTTLSKKSLDSLWVLWLDCSSISRIIGVAFNWSSNILKFFTFLQKVKKPKLGFVPQPPWRSCRAPAVTEPHGHIQHNQTILVQGNKTPRACLIFADAGINAAGWLMQHLKVLVSPVSAPWMSLILSSTSLPRALQGTDPRHNRGLICAGNVCGKNCCAFQEERLFLLV